MTWTWWLDVVLAALFTLRLIRLVVRDDLGLWLLRGPLSLWAAARDTVSWVDGDEMHSEYRPTWRSKAISGLMCPFCVGFHIAWMVLLSLYLVGGPGHAAEWWRWVCAPFALNWVTGHIAIRVGDNTED